MEWDCQNTIHLQGVWRQLLLPVLFPHRRMFLSCSLFPPPKTYGHLVVESRTLVSAWRVVDCTREGNCACDLFRSDRKGQFAAVVLGEDDDSSVLAIFLKMSRT